MPAWANQHKDSLPKEIIEEWFKNENEMEVETESKKRGKDDI